MDYHHDSVVLPRNKTSQEANRRAVQIIDAGVAEVISDYFTRTMRSIKRLVHTVPIGYLTQSTSQADIVSPTILPDELSQRHIRCH
jgi:hypothetical protein